MTRNDDIVAINKWKMWAVMENETEIKKAKMKKKKKMMMVMRAESSSGLFVYSAIWRA